MGYMENPLLEVPAYFKQKTKHFVVWGLRDTPPQKALHPSRFLTQACDRWDMDNHPLVLTLFMLGSTPPRLTARSTRLDSKIFTDPQGTPGFILRENRKEDTRNRILRTQRLGGPYSWDV